MVFTRTGEEFSTRLSINNCTIDKNPLHKILGVWISEDLSWEKNTKEICRKSYSRMSMLTKLKYIGTSIEYFLEIYVLFIRSISEYCSVAYHSSLTVSQSTDLERIQKTCLKIILGDNYINYPAALEMTGLDSLFDRREARCLKFALKSLKHPIQSKIVHQIETWTTKPLRSETESISMLTLLELNSTRSLQFHIVKDY